MHPWTTLLALACAFALAPARGAEAPEEPRRSALVHMVKQDCGSCHGLSMKGGLGPPLLPATLREKDPEQLRFVVMHGRRGTPMPPWSRFLTDAEAAWIVEMLTRGLPGD